MKSVCAVGGSVCIVMAAVRAIARVCAMPKGWCVLVVKGGGIVVKNSSTGSRAMPEGLMLIGPEV